jgi:hypothetical protein
LLLLETRFHLQELESTLRKSEVEVEGGAEVEQELQVKIKDKGGEGLKDEGELKLQQRGQVM